MFQFVVSVWSFVKKFIHLQMLKFDNSLVLYLLLPITTVYLVSIPAILFSADSSLRTYLSCYCDIKTVCLNQHTRALFYFVLFFLSVYEWSDLLVSVLSQKLTKGSMS